MDKELVELVEKIVNQILEDSKKEDTKPKEQEEVEQEEDEQEEDEQEEDNADDIINDDEVEEVEEETKEEIEDEKEKITKLKEETLRLKQENLLAKNNIEDEGVAKLVLDDDLEVMEEKIDILRGLIQENIQSYQPKGNRPENQYKKAVQDMDVKQALKVKFNR